MKIAMTQRGVASERAQLMGPRGVHEVGDAFALIGRAMRFDEGRAGVKPFMQLSNLALKIDFSPAIEPEAMKLLKECAERGARGPAFCCGAGGRGNPERPAGNAGIAEIVICAARLFRFTAPTI